MIKKFLKSILFKDVGDPSDIAVTNEWARAFITLILLSIYGVIGICLFYAVTIIFGVIYSIVSPLYIIMVILFLIMFYMAHMLAYMLITLLRIQPNKNEDDK